MPCSVMTICTECSLWSMCEAIGTIVLIFPPFAVDGQVKMERNAFRAKSPDMEVGIFVRRPDKDGIAPTQWTIRASGSAGWSAGPESQGR